MNNIFKTYTNMANNKKPYRLKTLEALKLTNYTIVNIDEYLLLDYLMDDEDLDDESSKHRYQVLLPVRDIKKMYDIVKDL